MTQMWKKTLSLAAWAALVVACGGNPEPPEPLPQQGDDDGQPRTETTDRTFGAGGAEMDDAARSEAVRRATEDLTAPVHFGYDQFSIEQEARDLLRRKADVLRASPPVRLRIEGHADERGSIEYNLALGLRRATAARDFLTNFGVEASRLEVVSFGEEQPADPGRDEAAYARNRRAEFAVTAGSDAIRPPGSP
ncbi:MAG TPA: OmpA family protein [Longimicrobiales bacterium]|nr:OmpA family protein [Longimicrobiales bacterium]